MEAPEEISSVYPLALLYTHQMPTTLVGLQRRCTKQTKYDGHSHTL